MSIHKKIVLRIAGVLAAFAVAGLLVYFFALAPQLRYLSAVSLTADIADAAAVYHADYGELPPASGLVAALRGENAESRNYLPALPETMVVGGEVIDPYGEPLVLTVSGSGEEARASVASGGPDGEVGADDDIDESHYRKVFARVMAPRPEDEEPPPKPIIKPGAG